MARQRFRKYFMFARVHTRRYIWGSAAVISGITMSKTSNEWIRKETEMSASASKEHHLSDGKGFHNPWPSFLNRSFADMVSVSKLQIPRRI
jgi:hypothetical protein